MQYKDKYINPFIDLGFKRLFGTQFNKDLLIGLLNQALGESVHIKDMTYLNTEQQGCPETDRIQRG